MEEEEEEEELEEKEEETLITSHAKRRIFIKDGVKPVNYFKENFNPKIHNKYEHYFTKKKIYVFDLKHGIIDMTECKFNFEFVRACVDFLPEEVPKLCVKKRYLTLVNIIEVLHFIKDKQPKILAMENFVIHDNTISYTLLGGDFDDYVANILDRGLITAILKYRPTLNIIEFEYLTNNPPLLLVEKIGLAFYEVSANVFGQHCLEIYLKSQNNVGIQHVLSLNKEQNIFKCVKGMMSSKYKQGIKSPLRKLPPEIFHLILSMLSGLCKISF